MSSNCCLCGTPTTSFSKFGPIKVNVCSQQCSDALYTDKDFIAKKHQLIGNRTIILPTRFPERGRVRNPQTSLHRRVFYRRLARNQGLLLQFNGEPRPAQANSPACVEIECPPQFPSDATCWRCIEALS